jgi:hypothetical protein
MIEQSHKYSVQPDFDPRILYGYIYINLLCEFYIGKVFYTTVP